MRSPQLQSPRTCSSTDVRTKRKSLNNWCQPWGRYEIRSNLWHHFIIIVGRRIIQGNDNWQIAKGHGRKTRGLTQRERTLLLFRPREVQTHRRRRHDSSPPTPNARRNQPRRRITRDSRWKRSLPTAMHETDRGIHHRTSSTVWTTKGWSKTYFARRRYTRSYGRGSLKREHVYK